MARLCDSRAGILNDLSVVHRRFAYFYTRLVKVPREKILNPQRLKYEKADGVVQLKKQ